MRNPYKIAIPCKLAPGMFASERLFKVELADGTEYRGIEPQFFCWNTAGRLVANGEPTTEAAGLLAARLVDELDEKQVAVEVPNGDVIAVVVASVKQRPTEIQPPTIPTRSESERVSI